MAHNGLKILIIFSPMISTAIGPVFVRNFVTFLECIALSCTFKILITVRCFMAHNGLKILIIFSPMISTAIGPVFVRNFVTFCFGGAIYCGRIWRFFFKVFRSMSQCNEFFSYNFFCRRVTVNLMLRFSIFNPTAAVCMC